MKNPQMGDNPQAPNEQIPQAPLPQDDGISLLERELAGLQNELAQNEASLEGDFARFLSENLTADDEELFFENKEEFFKKVLDMQNVFFNDKIASKQQRAGEIETEISQKKTLASIENAQAEFLKANPNADVKAMFDYFTNDIPPRVQRELESLAPNEFFNKLYELYKTQNKTDSKEDKIPKHYDGANVDATNAQNATEESYFNRI